MDGLMNNWIDGWMDRWGIVFLFISANIYIEIEPTACPSGLLVPKCHQSIIVFLYKLCQALTACWSLGRLLSGVLSHFVALSSAPWVIKLECSALPAVSPTC
jgi:hypothetical protein